MLWTLVRKKIIKDQVVSEEPYKYFTSRDHAQAFCEQKKFFFNKEESYFYQRNYNEKSIYQIQCA